MGKRPAESKRFIQFWIKEMTIKGWSTEIIWQDVNDRLARMNKPPITKGTIQQYKTRIKQEDSEWYLELMRDSMAYIILHKRKLTELDLVKKMIYDKIEAEGGIKEINGRTLMSACKTLHDIISTQSDLEKQIPYITSITSQQVKTPEEMKALQAQIIGGLSGPTREKYEEIKRKQEQELEERFAKDPTGGNVNLAEFAEDTYVI